MTGHINCFTRSGRTNFDRIFPASKSGARRFSSGGLLLQQCCGVFAGGVGLTAQHAGQLGDTLICLEAADVGDGSERLRFFGRDIMGRSAGGDGGQMGDAKHLSLPAQPPHFLADGLGGFAAHIGVHFVKDQDRDGVLRRQHSL